MMPIESTEQSFKLQDRTALIFGPCNSTTQSIALKMTQMGANVVLMDHTIEKMKRFAEQLMDAREINERYGRAHSVPADLSSQQRIQDTVSRAAECFGGIDIYIDAMMPAEFKKFEDLSIPTDIDNTLNDTLKAPILLTHGVMRFLKGRKRGRILYLFNDLGRMGVSMTSLQAIGRSSLISFSKVLAREVAENNITVNCIAAGISEELLLSQIQAPAMANNKMSLLESQQILQKTIPHAQLTEPEKVANMVAFLASPLASGITGQTIAVNQGLSFLS
jgi:3-oxoacyl-[acyl-carrier protein] reductase